MVKHILKDGTVLDDISGIVIKKEQFPAVYEILDRLNGGDSYEKEISNVKS